MGMTVYTAISAPGRLQAREQETHGRSQPESRPENIPWARTVGGATSFTVLRPVWVHTLMSTITLRYMVCSRPDIRHSVL